MNVQQLIDALEAIEDKTLTVTLDDWSEQYVDPSEVISVIETTRDYHSHPNRHDDGKVHIMLTD